MEHAESIIDYSNIEHQELSVADLDMQALYEWLDRPISEDDTDSDI